MREPTSVSLEKEVREDGKILATLEGYSSFSDFVNELIKDKAEVERFRIEEARKLRRNSCHVSPRT
jgi:predicted CopG family antitoxin